jgi:hypothetical protein
MVTKSTRMQSRRTSTAGKVFSAGELLEGELGINMVDKKLYSKDASGTVFQVAASPGRQLGNSPVYESFLGSDLQGIVVNPDGRVWFRRIKDKVSDFATVVVSRTIDPDAAGDNVPGTSAALYVRTDVNKNDLAMSQWPLTVLLDVNAPNPNGTPMPTEHVVIFGGGVKHVDAGTWGANIGMSDRVVNPTTASIGFELTMGANGLDPNNQRFGLLLAYGSAPANNGGLNEVTYGVTFGAPASQCVLKAAINFDCTAYTALNFTTMGESRGKSVMKMRQGFVIEWAESLFAPIKGSLGFKNDNLNIAGMAITSSAAPGFSQPPPSSPAAYGTISVNDQLYKLALYAHS